jgi:hypothetical protein
MEYVDIGCRVLLMVVFAWSAVSKVSSHAAVERFTDSLRPFLEAVPVPLPARFPAAGMIIAEAAVAVCLLPAPVPGLVLAAALCAVLTAGVALVVLRGMTVTCRCFGSGSSSLTVRHIVRNALLLTVACVGLVARLMADGAPATAIHVTVAVISGTVVAVAVARFDDLVDLFTPLDGADARPVFQDELRGS